MFEDRGEMEAESPADGSPKGGAKVRLLSMSDLDRRTTAARQAFEFRDRLISERGGKDGMGTLRLAMLDSVAMLSAMIRDLEIRWLKGDKVDLAELATLMNARRREALIIGVDPAARDVTPSTMRDRLMGTRP